MIAVKNLTVHAGKFVLKSVSFEVPTGGYCALMGKTGSGKTTILEAICGLKSVAQGQIVLDDCDVTNLKPADRNIGYVPQDGALFTTMTVRDHLDFALVIRRHSKAQIEQRVTELADLLEIDHLLDRSIHGLSGGERQRVALGRALSFHPKILCLDEPLSALDDETRQQMYSLLEHVRERTGVTTIHVTHNLVEAQRLADKIFWLDDGALSSRPLDELKANGSNGRAKTRTNKLNTTIETETN